MHQLVIVCFISKYNLVESTALELNPNVTSERTAHTCSGPISFDVRFIGLGSCSSQLVLGTVKRIKIKHGWNAEFSVKLGA